MKPFAPALLASLLCSASLAAQKPAVPSGVTIDVASARAVLSAVANPKLTHDEALRIAKLGGNQGLVRKENSYGRPARTADLAAALLAVAHGQPASTAFQFNFASVKAKSAMLTALVERIEAHPAEFRDWVTQRVAAFSPPDAHSTITGYLVAGGGSGGFAFGEPAFYLNLNYFSDFDTAKVVMAHELYHAVQGVYAGKTKPWWEVPLPPNSPDAVLAQQCSNTADLFGALYEEGSASYVGDPLLLEHIDTPEAKKTLEEFQTGLQSLNGDVTLLELSVTGLNAPQPVPFDDVYSLGFYVPEPLYKLGYVMVKAIDVDTGRLALESMLSTPAYRFADAYLRLPNYGKDYAHPKLGPNTVEAIHRLTAGCPRAASVTAKR